MNCTPQQLATASECFCGGSTVNEWTQTYLLAQIAGLPADPQALLTASNAFQGVQLKLLLQIQAYILCLMAQVISSENFLLLEDGTPLLLEDGTNFLLE